ncbi:unnamed protein product [Ectocarpus sp. 8 AP-2014]
MTTRTRAPPRMTAAYVDQMMTQRRAEELYQNELAKYNEENSMLTHAANNERRLAFQRRTNATAQIEAEEAIQAQRKEQVAMERRKERMSQQNQSLAEELQKRRAAKTREEVEIQRICQESEELKALEQRLKVAYVNKERAAQYEENRFLRQVENDKEQAIADKMEHDRQMALKTEADKVAARKKLLEVQRGALHAQMQERESLKREAMMEADRDREMVDVIVKKIEAEERAEQEQYLKSREETRRTVQEAERRRATELANRARQEKEEKENIRKYMEMVAQREAKAEEERLRKKVAADAAFKAVVEQTEKQNNEEDELRMLRDMLWEEELEAKRIQDDEDRKRKAAESKLAMMEANEEQLRQRQERRATEKEEENRLIQIMLNKFKEDEEREKRGEELRERMKKEHKKNIEDQREERAVLYEKEKEFEMKDAQAERERELYRQRVVEEARRRLLEQHGAAVEGYLPKGALKSRDELEWVRDLSNKKADGDALGRYLSSPFPGTTALRSKRRGHCISFRLYIFQALALLRTIYVDNDVYVFLSCLFFANRLFENLFPLPVEFVVLGRPNFIHCRSHMYR